MDGKIQMVQWSVYDVLWNVLLWNHCSMDEQYQEISEVNLCKV